MGYLTVGCAVTLIVVFAASGVGKLRAQGAFVESVHGLALFSGRASKAVAWLVIGTEIFSVATLSISFFIDQWLTLTAFISLGSLTVAFSVVMGFVLRRGTHVRCTCFGYRSETFSSRHMVRNAIIVLIALVGGLTSFVSHPLHPAGLAIAMAAGLSIAVILVSFDELLTLVSESTVAMPG